MKICFFSNDEGGCKWYRITTPSYYLSQNHQVDILKPPNEITLQFLNYDIFIIQRPHQEFYHKELIPFLKNRRNPKKVFIDMDDNLFELSVENPSFKFYTETKIKSMEITLSMVDGIICSTEPLAAYLKRYNPNVIVIPNIITYNTYSKNITYNTYSKLRVGWCGSNTHNKDFSDELIIALEKLQNEIQLVIYGDIPSCLLHLNIEHHQWTSVEEYYDTLNNLNLDVGLIPSTNTLFNFSKSNIKFLEYSVCKIVSIADTTYPYRYSIIEGETGFFGDWYNNLRRLVNNREELQRVSNNATQYVQKYHTYCDEYIKLWEQIL